MTAASPHHYLTDSCGALAAGAGFIALLGWGVGLPFLGSFWPGSIPMAPSTAMLFVLYGGASVSRARLPLHRGTYWVGVIVYGSGALVALLLCVLSYQGIYSDAETLGFATVGAVDGAPIGHMSPVTALGFVLAGVSFLALPSPLSKRPWRAVMAWCSACLLLVACAVLLLAYAYGTPLLYSGALIPPAATTCLAFTALGIAQVVLAGSQAWPGDESAGAAPAPGVFVVLILLATGIITAGYLYSRSQEAQYRVEAEHNLSSIAELKVRELENYRRERLGDASILLHNGAFAVLVQRALDNPADTEAQGQLRDWLERVRGHDEYERALLIDPHGAVRLAIPELRVPISSVITQRAAEVVRSGQVVLQDFYRNEHDQRAYLAIIIPILGAPDGSRALGVVALRIDPSTYLYPLINQWPVPSETGEILVVRRDGNDALFLNDLRFERHAALSLRIPLARQDVPAVKAILGQEGIVEGVDYRGVAAIAAVRRVPDSPWFLAARVATSEVYAPLRAQTWTLSALVVAILASAGGGLWGVGRHRRAQFYKERAQAAEALRASEIRYRRLFESAKDGILILDADTGRIVDVNPFLIELLGLSREAFLDKKIWELGFFGDIVPSQDHFTELQQRKYIRYDDRPLKAADGRRIDVEFVSNVYLVNGRKVIQCNLRDITTRKQAEDALREKERLLSESQRLGHIGSFLFDMKGPISWSEETYRLYGVSPDTFTPTVESLVSLLLPDDQPAMRAWIAACAAGDTNEDLEFGITMPDGTIRFLRGRGEGVREGNRVAYMAGTVQDVTERKRAETTLRESEARLASVVDSAMDGIITIDNQERILVFNAAAEAMFGCPAAQAIGQPVERFIPERFRAGHHGHLQRFGQSGEPPLAALRVRRLTGLRTGSEEFPIEASVSRTSVGGQQLFTIILRDIAERVRTEEARAQLEAQLRHAQRMEALGTLAAGIAHDFNNILGAIIGNAELASQDVSANPAAMESLDEIRKASHRAKDLVQRILAFGQQHLEPQRVISLRPVVEAALAFLGATIPAGVEIAATYDADAPTVRANATQIHQAVMNLCINAWHALEGHAGRIDIRLDGITLDAEAAHADAALRPGRFARLSVTDTGSGMDAITLSRIFDPFFTTKPVGQGSGLGLSVVHGIVKVHGGAITVTSQPGRGTTFALYFPAADASEQSTTPDDAELAASHPAGGGQHVLYLDDEESLVFLAKRLLERRGYQVSGYTGAEEALAAVRADPGHFDLVVTDLNMPGMSGLDVARELARLRPGLPVVLASGYITDEMRAAAAAAGVRELIYKPSTVENLCAAVERLAGAPKGP